MHGRDRKSEPTIPRMHDAPPPKPSSPAPAGDPERRGDPDRRSDPDRHDAPVRPRDADRSRDADALQRFLQRVWREDVRPLLADRHHAARGKAARFGGTAAGMSGLALDKLLGLRGKPFTRALTVLGSSLGALLPDALDWKFLARRDQAAARTAAAEAAQARAATLADREALALFELTPAASADDLRAAWRAASKRWHPDRARTPAQTCEFHVRFVACEAAYRRLQQAYEDGRLPEPHD